MPRPRLSSEERQRRANERLIRWRARIPAAGSSHSTSNSTLSYPFVYIQPDIVPSIEADLQRVNSSEPAIVSISSDSRTTSDRTLDSDTDYIESIGFNSLHPVHNSTDQLAINSQLPSSSGNNQIVDDSYQGIDISLFH
jgi:hypothetical protein